MKTSVLNIKIDPKVKRDAQKVALDLGFSLSAIVNASLKDLARSKTISYSLLEPTPLLKDAITSARADRSKKNSIAHFSNVPDMMKSLRS
jgi:addiction module RelB/DinJ family antitoxin